MLLGHDFQGAFEIFKILLGIDTILNVIILAISVSYNDKKSEVHNFRYLNIYFI